MRHGMVPRSLRRLFISSGKSRTEEPRQRGSVMVELAIVVPIIVVIGFLSIELTRALRLRQAMNSVAREVANESFRNCEGSTAADVCLDSVVNSVTQRINYLLPNIYIASTIYEIDRTPPIPAGGPPINREGVHDPTIRSKYTAGSPNFNTAFADCAASGNCLRRQTDAVIIVEIFYNYHPVFKGFGTAWGLVIPDNEEFYDAVIF